MFYGELQSEQKGIRHQHVSPKWENQRYSKTLPCCSYIYPSHHIPVQGVMVKNVEYTFIAITPKSALSRSGIPVRVSSMVQKDLFENYWYLIGIVDMI